MTGPRAQRRLAAILAADVVGYSRMMGMDETGTLDVLREVWTDCFNPAVARFQGRIVKMMGDGALVEFASAVDAVECAIVVQGAMSAFAAPGAGHPPVQFRIGVNLGDIVIEGDDIFGDGVNIASGLEAEAPKGGILVSDAVHAQVRGKVSVTFADAGVLDLKNIAAPIRAWRWGDPSAAPMAAAPTKAKATGTTPSAIPSVAVLPFTNMSGDAEQEYFSDGISEDIITDLSKISGLMVVARNSSFAYKGKSPDIRLVGRELGVTSVLEGSIRRAGSRVRITAQLIDARNGAHLWAERYDRDLTDIFAVQDEVTLQIVGALRVTLQPMERARLADVPTASVTAHDAFLQGRAALLGAVKDAALFQRAIAAFQQAIDLDPAYSAPYAGLAIAHVLDSINHWSGAPDALGTAARFAAVAVEKGPNEPYSHYAMGVVKVWQPDLEGAGAALERALTLSPNFSLAHGALGMQLIYTGQPERAIDHILRAMQLEPGFSHTTLHFLGLAELVLGHDTAAEAAFRERIHQSPNTDLSRALLAATLGRMGRTDEARSVWAEMMSINPKYSLKEHIDRSPFQRPQDVSRILDGLAKAGLPDRTGS